MKLDIIHYIILSLDSFSALILIFILLSSIFEQEKTLLLKSYIGMTVCCAFALLMEAISIAVLFGNYQSIQSISIVRTILNNLAIIGGYGLAFFYACYIANLVGPNLKACRLVLHILRIVSIIAAISIILGGSLGLFFTFENGVTVPGPIFVGLFAFDIIACLAGILLIIVYAKKLNTKDVFALLTLPTLLFVSAAVQYISFKMMYGLFLMCAISLFIIYLMIQSDRNKRSVEQEKRLLDMNIAVMRSQIQPHFLYNALSSIRRMIKKDPEIAATAVENFSAYLRQNLESMNQVEPIPFTTELKHLEEYLYLEKLRFGERLSVEYEINYSDFVLPVLSLQPIVENAVKHGILKREEGGAVWIKTQREGGNVILTVTDNGIGFNTDEVHSDGKSHIGFENVKRRIEMQCKGSVQVESKIGVGTTVTIIVPLL